ncbi:Sirohydrochlorin cobaltochelatase [Rubrivivax sp. A210]|uniref:sirohydrochlorin chelatase n=1 Tax=Rubrivivax sp. A210 TaxID=2772301 RepID=UPI0019182C70|nr:CbiX/SirB N-terminal domain-containing protein [Rubrivivax sp. A210]CAD5373745.1 Sirohydrochlorin cobaltochelatase [Rubrivivax sp. A210]
MTTSSGLILFAHGARDPRWAAPFEAVAERVRALRPGVAVRLAFLEIMSPSLPEAGAELARAGCGRIEILPLFLGAGGHVRRDLPLLLAALQAAHPALQLRLHPAVGEIAGVVTAMAAAALATLEPEQEIEGPGA